MADESLPPYTHTRQHLLDELALVRARAVAHTGSAEQVAEVMAPDPQVVARRVALGLAAGVDLRLPKVEATFGLTKTERAILLLTLAAEVDPLFLALTRGVQGEINVSLVVGTILELCTGDMTETVDGTLLFLPGSNLRVNALVQVEDRNFPRELPMQALRVKMDRNLALYLLGERDSSEPAWMKHVAPRPRLAQARLPAERKTDLTAYVGQSIDAGHGVQVEIIGPAGVGKKHLAEGICHELGRGLLVADCRKMVAAPGFDPEHLGARLAEIRREAMLAHALPYLDHYQALLVRHDSGGRPTGDEQSQTVQPSAVYTMPPELSDFISGVGTCFLGGEERFEPLGETGEVIRVELPFPSPRQRAEIWSQVFEEVGAKPAEDLDFVEIGRKLALDAARIQAMTRA